MQIYTSKKQIAENLNVSKYRLEGLMDNFVIVTIVNKKGKEKFGGWIHKKDLLAYALDVANEWIGKI